MKDVMQKKLSGYGAHSSHNRKYRGTELAAPPPEVPALPRTPSAPNRVPGNSNPEPWEQKVGTSSSQGKPNQSRGMGKSCGAPRAAGFDPGLSAEPQTFSSGGTEHLIGNLTVGQQDGFS